MTTLPISSQPHSITGILNPPDAIPSRLPTGTRTQRLPFEDLSWENFERLCHRLASIDASVEHCARYGLHGEAQEGIDVYARRSDGSYHCLQAKRHKIFGAAKLKAAVELFLDGSWAGQTTDFTISVQASMGSTAVQQEIERQAARLKKLGIRFRTLDGEALTHALRAHPVLIDDFFGRAWVEAILGPDASTGLQGRLDGGEFARLRYQLARVYDAQFQAIDPGSFGSVAAGGASRALTLLERFLKPDMVIREAAPSSERADYASVADAPFIAAPEAHVMTDTSRTGSRIERSRARRLPLSEWLAGEGRLVVLGDAGSGKSTILRAIALDLLDGHSHFPELAERWGRHVPVHISFARWASETARDGSQVGIKEIVRRSLQPMLTSSIVDLLDRAIDERRVLLLVDGLDEWSAEQAARTTLHTLMTTVEAHDMSVIVTGRPRGLERIGTLPAGWKRGSVAPLSRDQQTSIASTWFERHATAAPANSPVSDSALRTQRFMAELARDAGLAALAATPLLLIGLVTLALRGQILPRTKVEVYDQLVRILLEVHPVSRATASGDTRSRFQHAQDPHQRRAAIARLAFETRQGPGNASLSEGRARDVIRDHLASPSGCDLPIAVATAAAAEILAVNAETQGLIVEKAPGEVGFVHASFEEYLAAEHVAGWPFANIRDFVRERSGEARWRNVLSDLMAGLSRRDEFDELVAVVEEPGTDEIAAFQRAGLLGEIAFASATRSPATTRRLALETMRRVENSDWLPERRDALRTVLKGVGEPAFSAEIATRVGGWAPARAAYRSSLVSQLAGWGQTPELEDTLWRALHDEDRGVQRAAAGAYSRAFAPSDEAMARLVEGLARSRSLTASVAMLEALVLGWPASSAELADEAFSSTSAELRLVGAFGRAENGRAADDDRLEALKAQHFWSDVSYPHRELAAEMLLTHWPDQDALIGGALARADGNFDSPWELELAFRYVLNSSTDRSDVRRFILRQLGSKFPFNVMHRSGIWSRIGVFALADPAIRAAANAHWAAPEHRLIGMHKLADYAEVVPDDEISAILLEELNSEKSMNHYWSLDALLRGWGRDHPVVQPVLEDIAVQPSPRLLDVVRLLPQVIPDRQQARAKVLEVARHDGGRRDMVALALEALGCDGQDDEAVEAILGDRLRERGIYDPADVLFRAFSKHPRVRALALRRLHEPEVPLSSIAKGYGDDPEIAAALLRIATPLPTELRSQIVEVAAAGSAGTTLEAVLADGMREADPDLRVRMVTVHLHSLTEPSALVEAKEELLAEATAVGTEFEVRRGVALAGLLTLGDVAPLVNMEGYNGLLQLETGGLLNEMPSLERLICEKYDLLRGAFGERLGERFARGDHGSRLNEILAAAPSASPAARAAFLASAEAGTMPLTPAALRSLAVERPRSKLLLEGCRQMLERVRGNNNQPTECAEVALILTAEFPADPSILLYLEEAYRRSPHALTAVALAVYAPESEVLRLPERPEDLHHFGDWTAAMHAVGARADAGTFQTFLDAMIMRGFYSQFDAQHITNMAVSRRIQRDPEVERLLAERLASDGDPSVIGSYSRYLAAAGRLGPEVRNAIGDLITRTARDQQLLTAGYDAVGDRWRALRGTLLDALRAGID